MTTSIARQIQCVERELTMRRGAYPHMVSKGRMTQDAADEEMAAMGDILATLRAIAARDGNLPEPAPEALRRAKAVVLYFPTDQDRTEFLAVIKDLTTKATVGLDTCALSAAPQP